MATATRIALMAMENWTIQNKVRDYLLTDSGTQFISKVFNLLCAFSAAKLLSQRRIIADEWTS